VVAKLRAADQKPLVRLDGVDKLLVLPAERLVVLEAEGRARDQPERDTRQRRVM